LQLPDLVEEFLKPAIRKTLEESVRKQPYDLNRILQIVYMAQAVGDMAAELRGTLELVLVGDEATLRPALAAASATVPNFSKYDQRSAARDPATPTFGTVPVTFCTKMPWTPEVGPYDIRAKHL